MRLLIGNMNYSSWSMRPWLLLTQLQIPFAEEKLSFNDPDFTARVLALSPVGKVPVLVDGDVVVWDSLAIAEYLAEKFPERGIWPADPRARTRARSVCAEMHAGFGALRERLPMNCELRLQNVAFERAVERDIARIVASWTDCRERFGAGGPVLFGAFSARRRLLRPGGSAIPGLRRRRPPGGRPVHGGHRRAPRDARLDDRGARRARVRGDG